MPGREAAVELNLVAAGWQMTKHTQYICFKKKKKKVRKEDDAWWTRGQGGGAPWGGVGIGGSW